MRRLPASVRSLLLLAAGTAAALPPGLRAAEFDQRMANFSTRTQVGTGANAAFIGFAVGPGQTKTVLIRAVGPALTGFGVAGALPDPVIELFSSANATTPLARNDNWTTATVGGANAFASVGAFALTAGSRDAAMVATLGPGSYSAIVRDVANRSGIALVEVYDVSGRARLTNLSTRAQVGTGDGVLISGLAVAPGGGSRRILARAAGPALTPLGVAGALANPALSVIESGTNRVLAANDDWGTGNAAALAAAFREAGAFAFADASRDAALLVDLPPGKSYSVQVSGVGGTTGVALVEVYDLTPESGGVFSVVGGAPPP
ncbi:MAG: hypothetical protein ACO3G4_02925, partial [Opitutaceae bacterium]